MIVELQYNIGGPLSNLLRVSKYLHVIENESLVPRWVQRCSELLGCLAEVQEGDVSVRICELENLKKRFKVSAFETSSFLEDVRFQISSQGFFFSFT